VTARSRTFVPFRERNLTEVEDEPVKSEDRPLDTAFGRPLPHPGWLAGYAWLINEYKLSTPTPPRLAEIAVSRTARPTDDWIVRRPDLRPESTLAAHLEFALKHEGVDLGVLYALFRQVELEEIAQAVRKTPLGRYTRRLWFLYEWLTGREIDAPDVGRVRAVPVLDPELQFAIAGGTQSRRHRVIDNLPGTREFCPLVRRTAFLESMIGRHLDAEARAVLGRTPADVVSRAAAFLLLSDSRSSFHIEGERPSRTRAARWAQAIGQAGTRPLTSAELERLQTLVIGDDRMLRLGLRIDGGFVGQHDRHTNEPIPDHVSAKPEDLAGLMKGLVAYTERALQAGLDPVVVAAVTAFGFVYIHPFEDGNGRIHRWLIHHVLGVSGYSSPGVVFPISAAILREIEQYKRVLESRSCLVLPLIEWEETAAHNVQVRNDTASFYRYFDATRHVEFLYRCVEQTITHDLPLEVRYLQNYDKFAEEVKTIVEMPDRKIAWLREFLAQNGGQLSQRARAKEFALLTSEEVSKMERLYSDLLGGFAASPSGEG
jgi:hypothetical protein